jgi:hypothetical protein
MGGSMGSVTGEKFARACESAAEARLPVVSVSASGGARMQEGILALMQLPKTVCAVEDLRDAGCALISVMAHPTTGGLLASFASLGDVLIAEPGALMSFAGPRVVARQQFVRPDAGGQDDVASADVDLPVPQAVGDPHADDARSLPPKSENLGVVRQPRAELSRLFQHMQGQPAVIRFAIREKVSAGDRDPRRMGNLIDGFIVLQEPMARALKSSRGEAENVFRHVKAVMDLREGLAPQGVTLSNPEAHLLVELAYQGFSWRP